MLSASGQITPRKWWHDPAFAKLRKLTPTTWQYPSRPILLALSCSPVANKIRETSVDTAREIRIQAGPVQRCSIPETGEDTQLFRNGKKETARGQPH